MSCPMWDKESQTACLLGKKKLTKKPQKLKQTKKKEKTQGRLCRNSEVVHKSRLSPLCFPASTTSACWFVLLRCFRSCVVLKLSDDLKYCSCVVASPPKPCWPAGRCFSPGPTEVVHLIPSALIFLVYLFIQFLGFKVLQAVCPATHDLVWGLHEPAKQRNRCISQGFHTVVETPELYSSQNNLCCILSKL